MTKRKSNKYVKEVWDFSQDPTAFAELFRRLKKMKKMTVLINRGRDESFIVVGDGAEPQLDARQAKILLNAVNDSKFPRRTPKK